MSIAAMVFDALAGAARPLTRMQIERATGLVRDEVYKGLIGLRRRGHLIVSGRARERVTYALTPNAERPTADLRGRYSRTMPHRQMMRQISLGIAPARYRAASPPSHRATPGRSNVYHLAPEVVRPMPAAAIAEPCWLALLWVDPIRGEQ